MVEFIVSLVITALLLSVYHWYDKKAPVDKKMTWGEAMIASVYVFAVFFWVYGVVPHFWYWNHWQTRASRATEQAKATEAPSEFGRPLIRQGAR